MGIVDDSGPTLGAVDGLETSVDGFEGAQYAQHVQFVKAQAQRRAVDTQQVGYVEPSHERNKDFFAVHREQHAVEAFFEDLRFVIGQRTGRVRMHGCLAVLRHDKAVLIIEVGHGKSRFLKPVEEMLLRIAVVIEGLMVVDMIAGEVGEQRAVKVQSGDALLGDCVRRDLHERIRTAGIHHAAEQAVQLDGIGRRMRCLYGFVLDIIDHGREQSRFVAKEAHEFV